MVTVGQLASPERFALACFRGTSNRLYPDGNASFGASHASVYLQTSFAVVSNRHMSSQLGSSSFKRQTYASGAIPWNSKSGSANNGIDVDGYRRKFEALLYCGKSIPEEKIEKPTGLPAKALPVGNKSKCFGCEAKGAVECATCAGTGLYVDAVLESQGVIVRVRCLDVVHSNKNLGVNLARTFLPSLLEEASDFALFFLEQSSKQRDRLEAVQLKAVRRMVGTSTTTAQTAVREEFGIEPLDLKGHSKAQVEMAT